MISTDTFGKLGELAETQPFIEDFIWQHYTLPHTGYELTDGILEPFYNKLCVLATASDAANTMLLQFLEELPIDDDRYAINFDDLETGQYSETLEKRRNADASWLVFFQGRRTGVAVSAESRSKAITKARKNKRRGGDKVVSARQMNSSERKTAAAGKWVKSRPPGFTKSMRGKGPKPKASK